MQGLPKRPLSVSAAQSILLLIGGFCFARSVPWLMFIDLSDDLARIVIPSLIALALAISFVIVPIGMFWLLDIRKRAGLYLSFSYLAIIWLFTVWYIASLYLDSIDQILKIASDDPGRAIFLAVIVLVTPAALLSLIASKNVTNFFPPSDRSRHPAVVRDQQELITRLGL